MSDASNVAKNLRERLGGTTEERLGKALSDLLENPLLTGAIGRAFDAREKASQAQEVAFSALNIPSAADIERLTRRLRSVSHRLEGIEDGVDRLDRAISPSGVEARLSAIEGQLGSLLARTDPSGTPAQAAVTAAPATSAEAGTAKPKAAGAKRKAVGAKPKASGAKRKSSGAKPKAAGAKPKAAGAKPKA